MTAAAAGLLIAERDSSGLRFHGMDGRRLQPSRDLRRDSAVRICMAGPDVEVVVDTPRGSSKQNHRDARDATFPGGRSAVSRVASIPSDRGRRCVPGSLSRGGQGVRPGRTGVRVVALRSVLAEYFTALPTAILMSPVSLFLATGGESGVAVHDPGTMLGASAGGAEGGAAYIGSGHAGAGYAGDSRRAVLVVAETWFTLIALQYGVIADARSDRRPPNAEMLRRNVEFYLGRMFAGSAQELALSVVMTTTETRESITSALPTAQTLELAALTRDGVVGAADFPAPKRVRRRRVGMGIAAGLSVVPALGAFVLSSPADPSEPLPPERVVPRHVSAGDGAAGRESDLLRNRASGTHVAPPGESATLSEDEAIREAAPPSDTAPRADTDPSASEAAESALDPTPATQDAGAQVSSEPMYPYGPPDAPEGRYAFAGTGRSLEGDRVWYFVDRTTRRVVSLPNTETDTGTGMDTAADKPSADPGGDG